MTHNFAAFPYVTASPGAIASRSGGFLALTPEQKGAMEAEMEYRKQEMPLQFRYMQEVGGVLFMPSF